MLADEGHYDVIEIKECIDNGITPHIPEAVSTVQEDVSIAELGYGKVVLPGCLRCTIAIVCNHQ